MFVQLCSQECDPVLHSIMSKEKRYLSLCNNYYYYKNSVLTCARHSIIIKTKPSVTLTCVRPHVVDADLLAVISGSRATLVVIYIIIINKYAEKLLIFHHSHIPSHVNPLLLRVYPVLQLHM